jgi:hypothetical protein
MADAKSTFFGRSYIIARFISSIYGLLRTGTWLCDFKASFRLDKPDSLPENNQPPVWLTSPPLFRPDRMRDSHPISNSILPFYKHQTKSWVIKVLPTPMNEHMTIESRSEVADTFVHTDVLSKTMNPHGFTSFWSPNSVLGHHLSVACPPPRLLVPARTATNRQCRTACRE